MAILGTGGTGGVYKHKPARLFPVNTWGEKQRQTNLHEGKPNKVTVMHRSEADDGNT